MREARKERPLVAVTGSQQPYIFDLPHLLSLPAGFEFRFRYRPQWVASELLVRIRSDPEAFADKPLIIVFHSQQTKRLLPVRKANVISIEQLGPMIFLRFRVGPFVNAAKEGTCLRADAASCVQPETLHERAAVLLEGEVKESRDFAQALGDGMYFREASASSESDIPWADAGGPSVTLAWASLIEILQMEPELEGVPMFYLLGFQNREGSPVPPRKIGSFLDCKRRIQAFRLVERRRYSLRVLEWAEPPKALPQVRVECEYNPTILDLEGASNLVVGRYDALEFGFFARAPGYMELAIRAEPIPADSGQIEGLSPLAGGVPENSSWTEWPRILALRVPVKVAHNGWRVSVTLLAVAVGLLAYLFSENLAVSVVVIVPRLAGSPLKEGIQVAGLYVLFLALGEYVERFVKARDAVLKVGQSGGDESGSVSV